MRSITLFSPAAPTLAAPPATPLIIALDRLRPEDAPQAGGKGTNLGKMLQAGLPVPPGFCVTTEAFRQYLAAWQDSDWFWQALATLRPLSIEQAQAIAARAREQLLSVPVPASVAEAVAAAWEDHGAERAYAVRSSATAEDGWQASFAGQGETLLNVRGRQALLESVRDCWISLFSDRAILYRIHKRIDHRTAAMAVVVQELVRPQASGVLFTADPILGRDDRIILEASHGLGSALAAGQVDSDRIVLAKPSLEVLERQVRSKTVEIVPRGGNGVRKRSVDRRRAEAPSVDEALARRLGQLALQAEQALGGPLDMEWAATDEQVFVLQSRPITTLQPDARPHTVWSNVNTWEVLPGVVSPMTWSVCNLHWKFMLTPVMKALGIELDGRQAFGLIAGRAYANVSALTAIAQAAPVPIRLDFVEALGGEHTATPGGPIGTRQPAGGWNRLRGLARLPRAVIWSVAHGVDQQSKRHMDMFRRRLDELAAANLGDLSDAGLLQHLAAVLDSDRRFGPDLAGDVGVAAVSARLFYVFLQKKLGEEGHAVGNRLLGGLSGLASAEAGCELWQLADWTRQTPALAADVAAADDFASLRQRLPRTPQGADFVTRWDAFMRRYGHHARGEFDVYVPRWSETPDDVLAMFQGYLGGLAEAGPLAMRQRLSGQRAAVARHVRQRMGGPLQVLLFDYLLRKAQFSVAFRENARNQVVRMLAAVRRTLLELGRRLAGRGRLADRDEIFFLELAELQPLLAGADLGATLAARKAEDAYHQTITPPAVVVDHFRPHRPPPAADLPATQTLYGLPASAGVATGRARVMLGRRAGQHLVPGEILVAPYTDPGWTPYFLPAAAIVMDVGGMLSHGSIVAREYGVPAVVNVGQATRIIKTGDMLRVDGNCGEVTILSARPDG